MKYNSLLFNLAVLLKAIVFAAAQSDNVQDDLDVITKRRIADLAQFPDPSWFNNIPKWLASQKTDGTWADVNYLSGCTAQRANWPIQQHWNRLVTFASAWSGANPSVPANWTNDDALFGAISKGLDYWFGNDFTPSDCMGDGGNSTGNCPCGTPGLWNTNWYGQAILIPQLCSTTCLLVADGKLSKDQRDGCERVPKRAYDLRDDSYGSTIGHLTGANVVLVMQNSVSLALYTKNATILQDAFTRAMSVMQFADKPKEDGIHRDGTFLQHDGVLYNGNYGKDLLNAFIQLEGEAIGTPFAAGQATREAISAFVRGNEWMVYVDEETRQEHWDFNAIGRFVAFPTVDLQASADINFNVSKLAKATADFAATLSVNDTVNRLLSNGTDKLKGNKGFWASDYMVHRRSSFTLTNKMISTRSVSSESVNGANPYGYHLGQGNLYSHVEGNEYKDILAAWDWNLVPGTTVLLNTPKLESLNASDITRAGRKDFVGVVSNGRVGTSVQDYIDPYDGSISYQKAWFFLGNYVVVVTNGIRHSKAAPVVTILDNRAASGGKILVDGRTIHAKKDTRATGKTLFYGGNGYVAYRDPFRLTLSEGDRTGNWSKISTSTVGEVTVPIFSAYTTIEKDRFTYAVFPATSRRKLEEEAHKPSYTPITRDGLTGVYTKDLLSLVFWPGGPKSIKLGLADIGWGKSGSVTIKSDKPAVYLFNTQCKLAGKGSRLVITMSDPTQKATSVAISLAFDKRAGVKATTTHPERDEGFSVNDLGISFSVKLPQGGLAGSSVSRQIYLGL